MNQSLVWISLHELAAVLESEADAIDGLNDAIVQIPTDPFAISQEMLELIP